MEWFTNIYTELDRGKRQMMKTSLKEVELNQPKISELTTEPVADTDHHRRAKT